MSSPRTPPAPARSRSSGTWSATYVEPDWVQHKAVREIIIRRIAAESEKKWVSLAAFLDECESPEIQNLLTEAVAENRKIPNPGQQLE